DDRRLAQLGYEPVYKRSMSRWAILGLAFSVLSCWGEIGSSLTSGLNAGGPAGLVWSWIGVSICTIPVVWSLAEICSYHPTSGGQYFWVANMASPRYARGLSYATAWAQLAGLVGLGTAAAANVGESTFGMIGLAMEDFEEKSWMLVVEGLGIILICACFNIFGRRLLNGTGLFALVFGVGGLIVTVIVLLSMADEFQSARFVFTEYANNTGLSSRFSGVVVCLGITNASYVLVAYDEPGHHTEEMPNPQVDAPKAMVWSVYLGCVTGFFYLLSILFCITDLDDVLDADNPIFPIYFQATHSLAVSCVLGVILLMTQVIAEISFIAETSRSLMAFARDGGLPFSRWLSHVHPTLNVPIRAIFCSSILQGIVMLIYFGSSTAFLTIIALGTVGSYVSYAVPIGVKLWSRRDGHAPGPFAMGQNIGFLCNVVSILYLAFAILFFHVPARYPVSAGNMNY
ncbi:amino acid/polyamine transporter I, partial [Protomyces lactucae-debilis]